MEKHNKLNCWEFHKCGRETGGKNVLELRICPTSLESRLDGVHCGTNAGRACWVVSGSLCHGTIRGTFAQKYRDCSKCKFYSLVPEEEGENISVTFSLLQKIE